MKQTHRIIRSTTILGIRRENRVALAGDGQVTIGDTIIKSTARKVRKIYKDSVLVGFAGAAADALALFERFESKLEEYRGNLKRAAVELAKEWRTDRYLRRLEAELAVLDKEFTFLITGTGDIIEPDDDIIALGSGGGYALAAARALYKYSDLDAVSMVKEAMNITSAICIYTNDNIVIEEL